jgi:chemotaxis family two-component system sensor kinase Cph1
MRRTEHVDRVDSDLLALVMHDVRTPLAVISGYAKELGERWEELPDDTKRAAVDVIGRNGVKAARMLEEGLAAALTESGGSRRELRPFDLCAQVCELVADFAEIGGNRFVVYSDAGLPPVLCDPQRNWHVLANLLSNAVKFSAPRARIDIEVIRRDQVAEVSVRDRGVGISPARRRSLFHSRPGGVKRRAASGGIGLRLTRGIVEAQGGHISVASRPGRGSTFTYTVPLAPGPKAV